MLKITVGTDRSVAMAEGKFWVEIRRLEMAGRRKKRAQVNRDVPVARDAASWGQQGGWNGRSVLQGEDGQGQTVQSF